MPKQKKERPQPSRRINMSPQDVKSAQRLLALLAEGGSSKDEAARSPRQCLELAHRELDLRYRRVQIFGKRFAGEAPFALLLALYTVREGEPRPAFTRLTELAFLSHATALRWIELLADGKWIERESDPDDARKVLLQLTPKARAALDQLFSQA